MNDDAPFEPGSDSEAKFCCPFCAKRFFDRTALRQHAAAKIDAKRTEGGGWTRADLALWGVGWPPPKGWRKELLGRIT